MPRPQSLADFLHGWSYDTRPYLPKILSLRGRAVDRLDVDGKKNFREALLRADRFVLSDTFIERAIARSSTTDVAKLLANADLARLPSRPVLIEYSDEVRYRTQVSLGTTSPLPPEQLGDDWMRAGFLYIPDKAYNGWEAIHVSSSTGSMPVWPTTSRLHDPDDPDTSVSDPEFLRDRTQFLSSAWGITVPSSSQKLRFAMIETLQRRGYTSIDSFFTGPLARLAMYHEETGKHPEFTQEFAHRMRLLLTAMSRENAGSLRLSTAILASLNTVPTRIVRTVAKGNFQYRLRNLPKFDEKTVHIDARPGHEVHVYDRAMHEATGRHNRRHEVRGHWRDVSRSSQPITCAHEPAEVDGDYALCGKCTRLLRWIEHHERGDERLGWVFHDRYEVT
jgi:hypothetical protein